MDEVAREMIAALGEQALTEWGLLERRRPDGTFVVDRRDHCELRIAQEAMRIMRLRCSDHQIRWWFTEPNDRFAGLRPIEMIWQTRTRQIHAAAQAFADEFGADEMDPDSSAASDEQLPPNNYGESGAH